MITYRERGIISHMSSIKEANHKLEAALRGKTSARVMTTEELAVAADPENYTRLLALPDWANALIEEVENHAGAIGDLEPEWDADEIREEMQALVKAVTAVEEAKIPVDFLLQAWDMAGWRTYEGYIDAVSDMIAESESRPEDI